MKNFYGALVGFCFALTITVACGIVIHEFEVEKDKYMFFVGWIACMGYYGGVSLIKKSKI